MSVPLISETMLAYRLHRSGPSDVLKLERVPTPTPGPGQVLVKVTASGVCRQDVMHRSGMVYRPNGRILGHEIAGSVAAIGLGVTTLSLTDRVASTQRQSCHHCRECLGGNEVLCAEGKLLGEGLDGGYAQYAVIDELSLAKVPEGVDDDAAAIAACAIGTGYRALKLAGVSAGQRVLVTGASGGVGIHALQLARSMGAEVIAVTSSARKLERLERYADHVVLADHGTFDDQVRTRNIQPAVIIDLTANFTLPNSLRAVARGGTVVIVGNLKNGTVEILPGAFIMREIRLIGSKACTRAELQDVLQLLRRGLVHAKVHASVPLEEAAKAHDIMEQGTAEGRIVLLPQD
jgi:acryloyl-coenzyme A reductase